jgi:hypothetical protein
MNVMALLFKQCTSTNIQFIFLLAGKVCSKRGDGPARWPTHLCRSTDGRGTRTLLQVYRQARPKHLYALVEVYTFYSM